MTHCSICGWSIRSKTPHDMNNETHKAYGKIHGWTDKHTKIVEESEEKFKTHTEGEEVDI